VKHSLQRSTAVLAVVASTTALGCSMPEGDRAASSSMSSQPTEDGGGAEVNSDGSSTQSGDDSPPNTPTASSTTDGDEAYLEARVRRMTTREFTNTIAALLGTERDFTDVLAHDVPQEGYGRNQAQLVDPVFGRQLQQAAEELAAEAVATALPRLAPCSSNPGPECALTFIEDFGQLAYRRPLDAAEIEALRHLYELAAEGRPDATSRFTSGVQFVLGAMLQAPSFIYISQVGELAEPGEVSNLDQWEIASTLSYLVVAGPPDEELREAAAMGKLSSTEQRRSHAERLVVTDAGQAQVRAFIRQWLHLDKVATIDKSDPRFAQLRGPLLDEANAFIDEVTLRDDGTLSKLLTAGYTVVGPELEQFYGITTGPDGRASLAGTGRVGILQQGAFLAANSAANISSPIERAVALLDRVTCVPPLPPSFLDVVVKQPEPDPDATTRELFAAHAADPGCFVCHERLDGAGFPFESFGPIGESRTEQSGKSIDTSGQLISRIDADGPVADSAELSQRLAESADVKRCFARQLYRYAAAASDPRREETFLRGLEAEGAMSDRVKELVVSFAASDSFLRRQQPLAATSK